jgi:hypothetical protein
MKRFLKNSVLLIVCIALLTLALLPVYAAEDNPYGVDSVGCITDIKTESSVELYGAVNYFTSTVTSHVQGLEELEAIPYKTYGAIGSQDTRMFVYSVGTSDNLDYSTANVKAIVEAFERDNPQWNAIAAINGDFFDMENTLTSTYGEPEFPMIQLGDVYKSNVISAATGRGVVGTDAEGNVVYYTVGGIYAARGYGTPLTYENNYKLQILGESRNNPVCSYTAFADVKSLAKRMSFMTPDSAAQDLSGATVYVLKYNTYRRAHTGINGAERGTQGYFIEGEIVEVRSGTGNESAPDGHVLFFTPDPELFEHLKVGSYVKCQKVLSGEWAGVENAIGFKQQILAEGNILLKNCYGRNNPTGDPSSSTWTEDIYDYPYCSKNRTAIGFREDGTPVLLVIKRSTHSGEYNKLGASYYEIGEQLKALGCVNGFLLDGGGSSTMVIRDENGSFVTAYSGSGGDGRAVANAVILAVRDESVEEPKEDETIEIQTEKPTERPTSKPTEIKTDASETETESETLLAEEQGGCGSIIVFPAFTTALVGSLATLRISKKKRK